MRRTYRTIEDKVETIFGDRISGITDGPEGVWITFAHAAPRQFEIPGYRPRDELTYVSFSRPGKQVSRFAMRDDRTLILRVFAEDDAGRSQGEAAPGLADVAAQRRELHAHIDDAGWECP